MASRRPERVAEAMREVLSEMVLREVKDPRVGMVTLTRVDVSPDLRNAKVYFSCFGDEERQQSALEGLTRASGFLRSQVTKQLQLRSAPEIRFIFDRSIGEAEKLATVIRRAIDPEPPDEE